MIMGFSSFSCLALGALIEVIEKVREKKSKRLLSSKAIFWSQKN